MQNTRSKTLLLLGMASLAMVVVVLGSYVRATRAGLACPDWPLCFGELVPEFSIYGVPQEWLHRALAAGLGAMSLLLVVVTYQARRESQRFWWLSLGLLGLVIVQGIFGGLTVWMALDPRIVTTHLLLGTVFLQICLRGWLSLSHPKIEPERGFGPARLPWVIAVLVFLQMGLGGFAASSGASLSCPEFPLCPALFGPAYMTGAALTIYSHGVVGFALLGLTLWWHQQTKQAQPVGAPGRAQAFWVVQFMVIQVLLGLLNIYLKIPVLAVLAHAFFAQLILFFVLNHQYDLLGRCKHSETKECSQTA